MGNWGQKHWRDFGERDRAQSAVLINVTVLPLLTPFSVTQPDVTVFGHVSPFMKGFLSSKIHEQDQLVMQQREVVGVRTSAGKTCETAGEAKL